jgi:hypothetical protein
VVRQSECFAARPTVQLLRATIPEHDSMLGIANDDRVVCEVDERRIAR